MYVQLYDIVVKRNKQQFSVTLPGPHEPDAETPDFIILFLCSCRLL